MNGPSQRSDAELLNAHVNGDSQAFGELFLRSQNRLWAVALRITANTEDASDAVQEAVISAMRAAHTFKGQSAVSTWLHRIVTNAAIDIVRRRHPSVSIDELTANGSFSPAVTQPQPDDTATTVLDLETALACLPAEQRLAIYLVDYCGWPVADAARQMGVATGTVKSRCARGRSRLAPQLSAYGNRCASPDVKALDVEGGCDDNAS